MYDILIIGAGPSGLSAAIYAGRAGKKVGIISSGAPGGKMNNTSEIENYPGVNKVSGSQLSMDFFNQAIENNAEIIYGKVSKVTNDKEIILDNDKKLQAKIIIIATGLEPRKLSIKSYDK
jgi:thioredoxin reductase (NADPH)